ncbi:MAG: RluA family pseudouridine synthase [Clostridia bacterium]|nr:RluA family pseudouridine synthase [Clostridia bacterium]
MRTLRYIIPDEFDGKTVEGFLRGHIKMSLALFRSQKRVPDGITLNGIHTRSVDIIHKGDILEVNIPDDERASLPSDYPLEIIYEDEDILVINKPAELPMHESHNHQGDTLANAVAGYLTKKGRPAVFRAVGRLDKGTSGAVLCALNSFSASKLSGNIEKEYIAVPMGKYTEKGTVDKPIYRPDPIKTYRTADDRGDRAITHYFPVEYGENYSLLRIRLETGRTHQIRVHFAFLGTPLYGDTMYGTPDIDIGRQALHCRSLTFIHPVTNEKMTFEADLPEDMKRLLSRLRKS